MITIFGIPKAFEGHIGVIQRNAIRSWAKLHRDVQVVLCGDDTGCDAMAREVGADWLGDMERNEFGTPMLDDAFQQATAIARHDILVYANADIILLPQIVDAARSMPWEAWLMIGRRVDVNLDAELTDTQICSPRGLARFAELKGTLHGCGGMDYFAWPKAAGLSNLPPLAVGRPGWDNYFVEYARYERGLPLVDATDGVLAIHQNHDYRHVPGGDGRSYEGPEAQQQRNALGDVSGSVFDATHCFTAVGLSCVQGYPYRRARWKRKWLTRQLLLAESLIAESTATPRRWFKQALDPGKHDKKAA